MKKILILIMLATASTVAFCQGHRIDFQSGQSHTFLQRAQQFIDETRDAYIEFTNDDWSYSFDEYTIMVNEYRDIKDDLNRDEKSDFTRLRGEYVGFATKAGAHQVVKGAQNLYKSVSPFFEGMIGSFKDSTQKKERSRFPK